ncbi:MAG: hypothetical protein WC780_09075 [Lentimicrobiaceae bacterium]|jgi:hypothetical protein
MKRIFLFSCLILLTTLAFGQNASEAGKKVKSNEPATHYDRLSLTYMLLDFGTGNYYSMLKQSFPQLKTDDKYDDNSIRQTMLPSPVSREETLNSFSVDLRTADIVSNKLKDALVKNHIANAVIAKWFSRKDDGSFGVELLQQRGLYNATDADVAAANASKLGKAKLMDAGEGLLNNSFIIVFDVNDLIDMEESYNRLQKNSKTPISRTKNGFQAKVSAYVYKINFNDTINTIFWNDLWANPTDADLARRKVKFDNYNFPVTYYTRTTTMVEASQYNPGQALAPKVQATPDQLMLKLLREGVNNNLASIEYKLEEFKVKAAIFSTHPIEAKIGKKEGLKTDHRYFVYEMEQNSSGKITAKKKGVIRATQHITDNRTVSTGKSKTSRFYQVAGGRLDEGMLLQQRNDAGLALTLGASIGGFGGFDGRLDINLSRLTGAKMPTMIKLYIEGGYDPVETELKIGTSETISTYTSFLRYGAGFGKEFCFAHHFKFQPFAGIGLETASDKDDSQLTLSTLYGRAGVLFGINILSNVQLTYAYGTYSPFGKITDKDNKEVLVNDAANWKDALARGGATHTFGLRIEF